MRRFPSDNVEKYFNRFVELYGEENETQKIRYKSAFEKFKSTFSVDCAYVASSSGRVEVCGNHTDHNGGRVVSCAISLDTLAMFLPTNDGIIRILSEGYPEICVDINKEFSAKNGTSSALVYGVVDGFKKRNYSVGGFVATFTSNVLGGAGVSSSASFEVLVAEILNFLYNDGKIDCQTKAIVSQYAENVYFGKPCGLLDQTAIAFGGFKKLDFKNKDKIEVEDIKAKLDDYAFVMINTGGSHADLTDEYASIPREMKEVAKVFDKERLIDVDECTFFNNLTKVSEKVSDRSILRAIHFYEENARVDELSKALESENFSLFVELINQSGLSSLTKLQNCYVSGSVNQPIPKAISIAKNYLASGAVRVHGGGFAGSILCVVKNDNLKSFTDDMKKFYKEDDIIPLRVRSVGAIVL